MSLADKIFDLFQHKGSLINVNVLHVTNPTFNVEQVNLVNGNPGDSSPIVINPSKKSIDVNINALKPNAQEKLLKKIIQSMGDDVDAIVENNSYEVMEAVKKGERTGPIRDVLNELRGCLPDGDMPILRASLLLRSAFVSGEKIGGKTAKDLKDDIRFRYGDRGNKIANMCTAGYFETLMIPCLKILKSSGKSEHEIKKELNFIIEESAFALFVHSHMKENDVCEKAKAKIESNKKAGKPYLNVHGIGSKNVMLVQGLKPVIKAQYSNANFEENSVAEYINLKITFLTHKKIDSLA